MKNPTPYLKMRVLGAIDMAPGNTIRDRIKAVSQMTFTDEQGHPHQFTWRTIETWYCRYQKHGVTVMENKTRSDKGKTRKVSLEAVQEALDAILPKVHGAPKRAVLYRLCIEQGLLIRSQVAPNTFSRLVRQFDMLKPQADSENKHRLAFAKAHANDMWQADTLYGPSLRLNGASVQTRLIAFLDDASRVCCHGQFFPAENVDTLIEALRAAFYKRGVPNCLYVDHGSIYTSKEMIQICARVGCLLAQLDRAGLGHNTFSPEALALIVRSAEGLLRRTRNLCLSALIEAVRDQVRAVDLKQVNRVLIQPHWRNDCDQPLP